MKHRYLCHIALIVMALLSAACSTVYEGKYARDDGWRRGTILEVAQSAGLTQPGWRDCRKGLPAESLAVGQFATVEFFGSHRVSTITVAVQEGTNFKRNDHVYVNIVDCKAALESRLE